MTNLSGLYKLYFNNNVVDIEDDVLKQQGSSTHDGELKRFSCWIRNQWWYRRHLLQRQRDMGLGLDQKKAKWVHGIYA